MITAKNSSATNFQQTGVSSQQQQSRKKKQKPTSTGATTTTPPPSAHHQQPPTQNQPNPKRQKTTQNNGGSVSNPTTPTTPVAPTSTPQVENWHKERILFLFLNLIGQLVEVHVVTGQVYEGLFHTANVPNEQTSKSKNRSFDVVLKWARVKKVHKIAPVKSKKKQSVMKDDNPIETLVIQGRDVVQVRAIDITFATEKQQYRDESFVTDTEISNRDFKERELVPWQPSELVGDSLESLDDIVTMNKSTSSWDQFEVNYKKFGVTSTYEETLYTTQLDKNSEFYKQKQKEAERIAREIEKSQISGINSIHFAEERGHNLDDYTEEELYSSVIRPDPLDKIRQSSTSANVPKKYVPPQQRQSTTPPKAESQKAQLQTTTSGAKMEQKKPITPTATTSAATTTASVATDNQKAEPESKPYMELLDKKKLSLSIATSSGRDRTGSVGDATMASMAKLLPFNNVAGRVNRSSSFSTGAAAAAATSSPTTDPSTLLKERMRIRQHLTGSPSMSPRRSPIASPLSPNIKAKLSSPFVGDAAKIEALSLDPAKPKISEDIATEFLKFSLNEKTTNRQKQTEALKSFSLKISTVVKDTPSEHVSTSTSSASVSTITTTTAPLASTAAPKRSTILSNLQGKSKVTAPSSASTTTPQVTEKEVSKKESITSATKDHADKKPALTEQTKSTPTTATVKEAPKTKSTLNPNAPAFKFNPNAKSFTPSSFAPPTSVTPAATSTSMPLAPTAVPFVPPNQQIPAWTKPAFVPPQSTTGTPSTTTTATWANPKVDTTPIHTVYVNSIKKQQADGKLEAPSKISHTWPTSSKRTTYKHLEENLADIPPPQPMVQQIHMPFMPHPTAYPSPSGFVPAQYPNRLPQFSAPPPHQFGRQAGFVPHAPHAAFTPGYGQMYQQYGAPQQFQQQYSSPPTPPLTQQQHQTTESNK